VIAAFAGMEFELPEPEKEPGFLGRVLSVVSRAEKP